MLFGCNKYIYVDDVMKGLNLEKAREITYNEFFQKRMENKLRKINVGNWDILYTDSNFVYIGKPKLKRLFSNVRILDTLYKTDIETLKTNIPQYKEIQGFILKQKAYLEIMSTKNDTLYVYPSEKFDAQITEKTIEININATLSDSSKVKYNISFDKNDLKVLFISKLE